MLQGPVHSDQVAQKNAVLFRAFGVTALLGQEVALDLPDAKACLLVKRELPDPRTTRPDPNATDPGRSPRLLRPLQPQAPSGEGRDRRLAEIVPEPLREQRARDTRAFATLGEAEQAALRAELLQLWDAHNTASVTGRTMMDAEYLEVVATRAHD